MGKQYSTSCDTCGKVKSHAAMECTSGYSLIKFGSGPIGFDSKAEWIYLTVCPACAVAIKEEFKEIRYALKACEDCRHMGENPGLNGCKGCERAHGRLTPTNFMRR